ncbi:hypothetical protein C7B80_11945 [Cyanosarcina cf. burmensis CCALA 770]|nr:hypothetical protein C7B80_11945 [Cyanosarcina cf. burmensis CCALA 770]
MSHIPTSDSRALVNTHGKLSDDLATMTLARAYNLIVGDRPSEIPFVVWLLENPNSPFALPGKIHLCEHDYLHLLLGRGFSASDEAYVIGLTMGNDLETKRWQIWLYKIAAQFFYPSQFRFTLSDLREFDKGLARGRNLPIKNLNKLDFTNYRDWQIQELRTGLKLTEVSVKNQLH